MKTTSYLRMFIVIGTMMVFACSDPMVEPTVPRNPRKGSGQIASVEYHTSVTTWTPGQNGTFIGLVTQTPVTDLATADVYVVKNGQRIAIDRQYDERNVYESHSTYGEYFWAHNQNNVLVLNYISQVHGSAPPFPLEVIIVY